MKLRFQSHAVRNLWLVYLQVAFGTRFVTREQPTFTLLTHKILASNSTSKSANQRVCILSTHFLKPSKTKHFKNLRNWPASSNSRNLQKRGIIYCCWHPTRHRQVEEFKKTRNNSLFPASVVNQPQARTTLDEAKSVRSRTISV